VWWVGKGDTQKIEMLGVSVECLAAELQVAAIVPAESEYCVCRGHQVLRSSPSPCTHSHPYLYDSLSPPSACSNAAGSTAAPRVARRLTQVGRRMLRKPTSTTCRGEEGG
jgi:hypothetical protein